MDDLEELQSLRRLAELEAKAATPAGKTLDPAAEYDKLRQQGREQDEGLLRSAAGIGATLLKPVRWASDAIVPPKNGELNPVSSYLNRIDDSLKWLDDRNKDSGRYTAAKVTGDILATAPVGGALAEVAQGLKAGPAVVNALRSGGFETGLNPTTALGKVGDLALRAGAGATTGGVSAGLIDPSQAKTGAVIGGALPVSVKAAGAAGSAIANTLKGDVSPEVADLAMRAKQLGIDIPADRIANSKPLNATAAALNYVPFSGRQAVEARMQDQLNRAVSRTFGQDSTNVTQALRKADDALGAKFDAFLQSNKVYVDKTFLHDLAESANQATKELGADGAAVIKNQVDEIVSKAANGEIDGQAAYNIKRVLDRIGRRNSPEAGYALDLKRKLMDALNRSVGPESAQAFGELRKRYGNMLELQKLATNGAEGDISIARLANLKNIGSDDLQELADISAQFLKPREGQHGAAQRALAGGITLWLTGPKGLVAGATAGRAANAFLDSDLARRVALGQTNPELLNLLRETTPVLLRPAPVLSAEGTP